MTPRIGDRVLVTDVFGEEWPAEVVSRVREAQGVGGRQGWFLVDVRLDASEQYPRADRSSTPWPLDSVRAAVPS